MYLRIRLAGFFLCMAIRLDTELTDLYVESRAKMSAE